MIDDMFVFDSQVNLGFNNILPLQPEEFIDQWVNRMDIAKIDMALVIGPWTLTPEEQKKINILVSNQIRRYPQKFIGLSRVSPFWGEKALDEIKLGVDLGLRGVKLYSPGHGHFPIDSKLLDPIMGIISKNNLVLMIHTDVDSKVSHPLLGVRLAERFPEIPIILTHMGMNSDSTHFIPDYVKNSKNVYLNTANTPNLPQFVYKTPMDIIPDRMLFGSDGPDSSPEVELKKVEVAEEKYGLTKIEKRKVLGQNAMRLFNL
jgi:uncharacterized protein